MYRKQVHEGERQGMKALIKNMVTGTYRITLSAEEKELIKRQAKSNGMTITGYVSALLRNSLKEPKSINIVGSDFLISNNEYMEK